MKKYISITILFIWFSSFSFGQEVEHLFVYIENVLEDNVQYTYGDFSQFDEKLIKNNIYNSQSKFESHLDSILLSLPVESRNVLYYIHGLWADTEGFYQPSSYILQNKIFNASNPPYGLIISLQWEGVLNYKTDIPLTTEVGKLYGPIVQKINERVACYNNIASSSFLCHSMGNRVFQSLMHELKNPIQKTRNELDLLPIDYIFFCAADLPDTAFEDQILMDIVSQTKSTLVFHHHHDRTLAMAKTAVPGNRLGISGPSGDITKTPIKVINVTTYDDFESIPGNLSLHRYFYDSPRVRKLILSTLNGQYN